MYFFTFYNSIILFVEKAYGSKCTICFHNKNILQIRRIAERDTLIQRQAQHIAERDTWIAERDTWIADRNRWIAERDVLIRDLQQHYQAVLASRAFRWGETLLSPLRRCKQWWAGVSHA